MIIRLLRVCRLSIVVAACALGLPAQAGDPSPRTSPARHPPAARHRTPSPSEAASLRRYSHDLFRGSDAQQAMERSDNERANARPVNHGKDDFFSDWRGLK